MGNILMFLELFKNSIAFAGGLLLSMLLVYGVKIVYQKNMNFSWFKIFFSALMMNGFSAIFLSYSNITFSVLNLFLLEFIASVVNVLFLGWFMKVHTRKNYAHFIMSYYFCYFFYMIIYFVSTAIIYALTNAFGEVMLLYYLVSLVAVIFYLFFIILIKMFNLGRLFEKASQYSSVSFIVIFLVILDTLLISLTIQQLVSATNPGNTEGLEYAFSKVAFSIGLLVISNVILIGYATYLLLNIERVKRQEHELLQQNVYIQKLENLQLEMRSFKHDYQNVLSSMYLQVQEGDISSVQNYLGEVIDGLGSRIDEDLKVSTELAKIKNQQLKSTLLIKLMNFEQSGVPYELEIVNEIDTIAMNSSDFSRIIGILLDNAKEESEKIDNGNISLVLLNETDALHVMIKNKVRYIPDLTLIWKQGYSTKGENRGTGLSSYHQILDKYDNVLKQTKVENDTFIQMISIYRKN